MYARDISQAVEKRIATTSKSKIAATGFNKGAADSDDSRTNRHIAMNQTLVVCCEAAFQAAAAVIRLWK